MRMDLLDLGHSWEQVLGAGFLLGLPHATGCARQGEPTSLTTAGSKLQKSRRRWLSAEEA